MNMNPEQRKLHDALIQQTIAAGKLIEVGFIAMRAATIAPDAPEWQVQEMRNAYMSGAQHLFASIMTCLDPGTEPTDADLGRMSLISAELEAFGETLKSRLAESLSREKDAPARSKPTYSIEAPDQPRLKIARLEIEAILKKHDVAGVVALHTPGMGEFFYDIRPSYSVCWIDEAAAAVRIKSNKDRDHGGDAAQQLHDQAATANMLGSLRENLACAAVMFEGVQRLVDKAIRAEHTPSGIVPDPRQENPS